MSTSGTAAALSKSQKSAVAQLRSLVACSESAAISALAKSGWSVERSAGLIFDSPSKSSGAAAAAAASIQRTFDSFQDPAAPGKMNIAQLESFFGAIGLDVFSDVLVLVITFQMGAKVMGVITKDEFSRGFQDMGVSDVSSLKARLPALRAKLGDPDFFRRFWAWSYSFNCEEGQKTIKLDTAIEVTKMLLREEQWPLAPLWVEFLEKGGKTPSRDAWCMIIEFFQSVKPDMSDYDSSGSTSWPVMLDEFAEFVIAKIKLAASAGGALR